MLTYRLKGTTEQTASNRNRHPSLHPRRLTRSATTAAEATTSSLAPASTPRCSVMLTCGSAADPIRIDQLSGQAICRTGEMSESWIGTVATRSCSAALFIYSHHMRNGCPGAATSTRRAPMSRGLGIASRAGLTLRWVSHRSAAAGRGCDRHRRCGCPSGCPGRAAGARLARRHLTGSAKPSVALVGRRRSRRIRPRGVVRPWRAAAVRRSLR